MSDSHPLHRVHRYAAAVLAGDVVAGPLVRLACERHERDVKLCSEKGFYFDEASADYTIGFIESLIKLPDTEGEDGQPKAFTLEPWQAFIVGSLFGWRWTESKFRRFRNAYIEVGKGNGKTPLLAAIGLFGLMADGQRAPEIYAVAADRDQAGIMFRDAVRMVEASPALSRRIHKTGIHHITNLAYGLGFFRPFSRDQSSKSGTRPHMGLIDELHEHPNADIVNKSRAGAKGNQNALFAEITNSGFDRTSICWQHHEHSRQIVEQSRDDERWFSYVCSLDEGEDPLIDESCWLKVNPNLGVSIQKEYLQDQVSAAKNIPSETNTVLRLNFCVWTQAQVRAIDMGKWRECQPLPPDSDLVGKPCYGAFDLGMSDDFSAWARIWDMQDGRIVVKMRYWLPEIALEKYRGRYEPWQRAGILKITEGDTTDQQTIEAEILADCQRDGVREVGFDNRFATYMANNLKGAGVKMVDQPQGFQLNEPIQRKLQLIVNGLLCHGNDPILTWMADNYVLITNERRNNEVRPAKDKAPDKIDGQVALDMAIAAWIRQEKKPEPTYQIHVFGGAR